MTSKSEAKISKKFDMEKSEVKKLAESPLSRSFCLLNPKKHPFVKP